MRPLNTFLHSYSRHSGIILSFFGAVLAIALWFLVTLGEQNNLHRFEPIGAYNALMDLLQDKRFWAGLTETLKRLIGALIGAAIVGVPTGVMIGYFARAQALTYIPFQLLRMVSPLSWTPIAIILFGIGSAPVYFLVFMAAVWPVIFSTANGIKSADPVWIDVGKSFGGNDWAILKNILLRASLPSMILGVQLALGVAWIVIVPAEMLGVASGLGYMILDFRDVNDYASIAALIIVIGILGVILDYPLRKLIQKMQWN